MPYHMYNGLPGTQCQTMLRWEVTMATAGCSATATLGRFWTKILKRQKDELSFIQPTLPRCVKRVSRALLAKPMWTIAYENSFLDSLVELDFTYKWEFLLHFEVPVDSGWSLCHKSKLRQVWNVQRSFLCTEQHPSSLAKPRPPWRSFDQI